MVRRNRFRWRHGLVFFAGVQAVSFGLRKLVKGDPKIYARERLPKFAPPPVAFPIAWTINSVAAIAGGLHVLNLPSGVAGRSEYLKLQAAAWTLFSTFNFAYFGLRSPLNAAAITVTYAGITVASVNVAATKMRDRPAVISLLPTAAWLVLATPLGIMTALYNRDRLWKAGPFM